MAKLTYDIEFRKTIWCYVTIAALRFNNMRILRLIRHKALYRSVKGNKKIVLSDIIAV